MVNTVPNLGVMALEDDGRVDFARLRRQRRQRVLDAMAERDFDVLILGREANARYATGARRLWMSGTRPFAPGCVLVHANGSVHLLNNWDEGIPTEIPRDHLFGLSWNPVTYVERLKGIPGLTSARRIGVDAMTPLWRQLLGLVAPAAELRDAQAMLLELRMRKSAEELRCIRTAVAIAEASLAAAIDALRPGIRERTLLGAFNRRMTAYGITAPSMEGTFCAIEPGPVGSRARVRRLTSDRHIDAGALVALSGGVLYAGYEGAVGRTWPCIGPGTGMAAVRAEHRDLRRRWTAVWNRVADRCRPGATGDDLRAAYEASGETLPPFPIAYSVGIGYEAPIPGSSLGPIFDRRWRLEPGMVLGVQAYVAGSAGGYFGLETVLITPDGHEVLSSLSHGPLLEAD